MKKQILALVFVASAGQMSFAAPVQDFFGSIKKVTMGEFDPFVVGEACLIEIQEEHGGVVFGLVTDYEECVRNEEELVVGRGAFVAGDFAKKITKKKTLKVLSEVSDADVFYEVEFGSIENGLLDQ